MRVQIATTHRPFGRSPGDLLAEELQRSVREIGYPVEIVRIPFKDHPPESAFDHLLAAQLLALPDSPEHERDLLIALEFPACLIRHPQKVLWLVEQPMRPACGSPCSSSGPSAPLGGSCGSGHTAGRLRAARREATRRAWAEAKGVFAISATVSYQIRKFDGLEATPLYPPPRQDRLLRAEEPQDYLLVPLEANAENREELLVEALAHTRQPVRLLLCGRGGPDTWRTASPSRAALCREGRCRWTGEIGEAERADLFSRCRAVLSMPRHASDPDTALAAALTARPLITGYDSGALAELVEHRQTGWVIGDHPSELASVMDEVWSCPGQTRQLGANARERAAAMHLTWPQILQRLLP